VAAYITVRDGDLVEVADVEAHRQRLEPQHRALVAPVPERGVQGHPPARRMDPFCELARHGSTPLGAAVTLVPAGCPTGGIIHMAGIDLRWRASPASTSMSTRSALAEARARGFGSLAFLRDRIEVGGVDPALALEIMVGTARESGAGPKGGDRPPTRAEAA
jgi:hypothetical protein